jgi:hypothetical protein
MGQINLWKAEIFSTLAQISAFGGNTFLTGICDEASLPLGKNGPCSNLLGFGY